MGSTPQQHHQRLIEAYLADLQRALAGMEEGERAEVIASVREHIDSALEERPGEPTAADVEAVLRGLGPVERIASHADARGASARPTREGGPAGPTSEGGPAGGSTTDEAATRHGTVLVALGALSLLLIVVVPPYAPLLALVVIVMALMGMRGASGPARTRYRIAAALSGVTISLALVALLGLLAWQTSGPVTEHGDTPAPSPTELP